MTRVLLFVAQLGAAGVLMGITSAYLGGWLRNRRRIMMLGAALFLAGHLGTYAASAMQELTRMDSRFGLLDHVRGASAVLVIVGGALVIHRDNRNLGAGK